MSVSVSLFIELEPLHCPSTFLLLTLFRKSREAILVAYSILKVNVKITK